jgi:hypothetical protein
MEKIDVNDIAKMEELMEAYKADAESLKPVFPVWAKERINALKNLQCKITTVEDNFFADIQDLERKYASQFSPLYDERTNIVTGLKEKLSDEEKKWNFEDQTTYESDDEEETDEKTAVGGSSNKQLPVVNKNSLPNFWFTALKSTKMISELILEHDEPVFEHLTDIRCKIHEQKPYGYTIEFHFSENEYFKNKVLTKTYELICDKDENRPFLLARGHFYKCKGCTIDWKKGKDLSLKVVKSKEEDKKSNVNRIVCKEEQQDTFFTFFVTPNDDGIKPSVKKMLKETSASPNAPDQVEITNGGKKEDDPTKTANEDDCQDDEDRDLDAIFEMDFEIGHFLKDTFIPKSVLYYIGEIPNENTDDFDEQDMYTRFDEDMMNNDDDDEDDFEDEEDEDEVEDDVDEKATEE